DDVLRRGVQSVSELVNVTAYINLDFADVTSVMKGAGYAHMGMGSASGKDKAELAAKAAISSPLLETSIDGARGILVSITASPDIGLEDIDTASAMITNEAHPDANIIWGVAFDPALEDEMRVTIIATGFDKKDIPEQNKNARAAFAAAKKPAMQPAEAPAEKKAEDEDAEEELVLEEVNPDDLFTNNELTEILNILNQRNSRTDNNQGGNNPMGNYGRRRF
ncbi:MAG: cell division protein FtsZ, partial [Clostridia bacterium]|nr:cell division protein FtsZ [Clostridia bacterium]